MTVISKALKSDELVAVYVSGYKRKSVIGKVSKVRDTVKGGRDQQYEMATKHDER